jgi:ribosomal protein S18 acetylase RimI-like enzyme
MMLRNGVDLHLSVGAYDGSNLVGFVLNGRASWADLPTLYDSGTGMIKEYRGKKHATVMFDLVKERMHQHAIFQYLLEVIQVNTIALSLYKNQGFSILRELACYSIDKKDIPSAECSENITIRKISAVNWNNLISFWNAYPSWQNSIQAIERIISYLHVLGIYAKTECIGYTIFHNPSGEILHLAVKKTRRREGIGTLLLNEIIHSVHTDSVKIINVDKTDATTIRFLETCGFTNDVNQYEMLLHL